jgi:hypothetical protein
MKTIQCHHCQETRSAEARGEVLDLFLDHYLKDHKDLLDKMTDADKEAWMERFEKEWKVA